MVEFLLVQGDHQEPDGYRLLSPEEARDLLDEIQDSGVLDEEEYCIARLAEGGSMDGPGCDYEIRDEDSRTLGHSLCIKVDE